MKTAVQLYSVRDDMAADFAGTLKKVGAMGYEGVEFAGLYGHSAEEVKAMCADAGVTPISAHVPLTELMNNLEEVLDMYAAIGCKYVVIPHMSTDYLPGHKDWDTLQEIVNRAGAAARARGMILCYHNHNFEFERVGGEWAMDLMYKAFSPDVLQTEIDTCWVNVAGLNPAEYVRQYKGRAPIVHLKDFHQEGHITGKLFDLIGVDDDAPAQGTNDSFGFRPVGYGCQDIPAILAAAAEAGAAWVAVEQDHPSGDNTPMECIKMSIDYLKTQTY